VGGAHLAQHIERLLDDPAALPRAATAAAATADAAEGADAADAADAVETADVLPVQLNPSHIDAVPTSAAPAPIMPTPLRPKAVKAHGAPGPGADNVARPTRETRHERQVRLAQAKHERRLAAVERRKLARQKAKAEAGARAKAGKKQAGTEAKPAKARAGADAAADSGAGKDAKGRKAAALAQAKARKLAVRAEAKARRIAARAQAKARKAQAKAARHSAQTIPAANPPVEGEVRASLSVDGADATELYYSGKRKLDAGDAAGAIADLKASQRARASARTLTLLGRAHFDAGELSAAAKALRQAGSHDDAQLLLATLYQQTGKTSQARKVYEAFLKAHPDHKRAAWVRNLLQSL